MSMNHFVRGFVGAQPLVYDWAANKQVATMNFRAHSIIVVNKNAATMYVQIFDSASGAAGSVDGANIPRYEIPVPAGELLSLTDSQFAKGIFIQAVTVQGSEGTNILATSDLKITVEGLTWPQSS